MAFTLMFFFKVHFDFRFSLAFSVSRVAQLGMFSIAKALSLFGKANVSGPQPVLCNWDAHCSLHTTFEQLVPNSCMVYVRHGLGMQAAVLSREG